MGSQVLIPSNDVYCIVTVHKELSAKEFHVSMEKVRGNQGKKYWGREKKGKSIFLYFFFSLPCSKFQPIKKIRTDSLGPGLNKYIYVIV